MGCHLPHSAPGAGYIFKVSAKLGGGGRGFRIRVQTLPLKSNFEVKMVHCSLVVLEEQAPPTSCAMKRQLARCGTTHNATHRNAKRAGRHVSYRLGAPPPISPVHPHRLEAQQEQRQPCYRAIYVHETNKASVTDGQTDGRTDGINREGSTNEC